MEGTCCGWGLSLMCVFLSSEGGPEGRIEIRLIPGGYLVKPVFQVAAGIWTYKAHGHSPTQRGQMAEKGCLCGCRKLLQQPGLPGCASPPPCALGCCKGEPSVQITGVVSQVCPQPNAPKCQAVARQTQLLCIKLISDWAAVWEPYLLFMSILIALLWVLWPWASFHSSSISSLWAPKSSSGIFHELKWKCLSVNTATMKYVHLSAWGLGLWAWWTKATLILILAPCMTICVSVEFDKE